MKIRKAIRAHRAHRWWVGLLVLAAIVSTVVSVVPGGASTSNSAGRYVRFYASCMAPFVSYPPEKRAIFEHECRVRGMVSENVTPAEEEAAKARLRETWPERQAASEAAEAASPPPPRRTELSTSREGPIGTNETFDSTGYWVGEADGQWYQVYAGTRVVPTREVAVRSELLVYTISAKVLSGERPVLVGRYTPPAGGTEPLRIVAYQGDVLDVRTSTGALLSFDVADLSFGSKMRSKKDGIVLVHH
jgi:hypothetical protein